MNKAFVRNIGHVITVTIVTLLFGYGKDSASTLRCFLCSCVRNRNGPRPLHPDSHGKSEPCASRSDCSSDHCHLLNTVGTRRFARRCCTSQGFRRFLHLARELSEKVAYLHLLALGAALTVPRSSTESTISTSLIHSIACVGNCEQIHTSVLNLVFPQANVAGLGNLSK